MCSSRLNHAPRQWQRDVFTGKNDHADGLARDLAQVVSEPIFDIARLVEATRDQRLDPLLGCGSPERSDACIPPGAKFDVRRQAGVDEALGLSDRPFVELGDPGRERFNERIQLGVGRARLMQR